jgi:Ca2+-binding RTX toxin-like protein
MANITGTAGDDLLLDSNFGQSDVVLGLGGNDTITGGTPYLGTIGANFPDTLDGGDGNDTISIPYTFIANQLLIGGNGNDLLKSSAIGANTLQGGNGNDTLESAGSDGTLQGGDGNDVFIENGLFLGNSANTLEGGAGDDIFEVISKNTINGGEGFDAIGTYYFNNPDSTNPVNINVDNIPFSNPKITNVETAVNFTSGAGNDILTLARKIGDKLRTVDAGDGNDLVTVLGDAHASINGGKGVDRLYGGAAVDILNGGDDDDFAFGGGGDDSILGGLGLDNLEGNGGNDTIRGEDGDDGLAGQEGNDELFGDAGNDRLYGWTGNDRLYGGIGNDTLYGDDGNDTLYGDDGNDLAYGGTGNDSILGGLGIDNLEGNAGNDTIRGDDGDDGLAGQEGDDLLVGGNGRDRLYGWIGNDMLNGDAGNDSLYGDGGNDTLRGGQGNDRLTGDYSNQPAGADTFAFDSLSGANFAELGVDTITDFQSGSDKILLGKTIFTALPDTLTATSFQTVEAIAQAATSNALIVYSQGQLFYNANGSAAGYGNGGLFVVLEGTPAPTLTAHDFVITGVTLAQ